VKRSPLTRRTPLRAITPWRPPRVPLAHESSRRRAERRQRAAVVAEVLERDGGCVARASVSSVPCHGALVVHETAQRSVVPGSHLRADLAVALCHAHHEWAHRNIAEARALGLIVDSWDVA